MAEVPPADIELATNTLEWCSQSVSNALEVYQLLAGHPNLQYAAALEQLTEIKQRLSETAKTLGLRAVQEHAMTRRDVAKTLNVHPITISRWLTAHQVEQAD